MGWSSHLFKALKEGEDVVSTGTGRWWDGGSIVPECHHSHEETQHSRNSIDP